MEEVLGTDLSTRAAISQFSHGLLVNEKARLEKTLQRIHPSSGTLTLVASHDQALLRAQLQLDLHLL
jgi:hypothetical protein